ncbi:MAG: response regulator [Ktedonobacterales bacterium]|nr:response regulator [Ktedonobacterales bacterium]
MLRVLVANDDATSRRVLHHALTGAGYEVVEATTKAQTMTILRESPIPLVVLLDFSIAKWNGTAVISEASADPVLSSRHAYVLMLLRDQTFPLITARAMTQMSVSLIPKPIKMEAVVSAVMAAGHRLQQHNERTIIMPRITEEPQPPRK